MKLNSHRVKSEGQTPCVAEFLVIAAKGIRSSATEPLFKGRQRMGAVVSNLSPGARKSGTRLEKFAVKRTSEETEQPVSEACS
jgi:hypothetical protein